MISEDISMQTTEAIAELAEEKSKVLTAARRGRLRRGAHAGRRRAARLHARPRAGPRPARGAPRRPRTLASLHEKERKE